MVQSLWTCPACGFEAPNQAEKDAHIQSNASSEDHMGMNLDASADRWDTSGQGEDTDTDSSKGDDVAP